MGGSAEGGATPPAKATPPAATPTVSASTGGAPPPVPPARRSSLDGRDPSPSQGSPQQGAGDTGVTPPCTPWWYVPYQHRHSARSHAPGDRKSGWGPHMHLNTKPQQSLVGSAQARADASSDTPGAPLALPAGGAKTGAGTATSTSQLQSLWGSAPQAGGSRGGRILSDVVFAAKRLGARVQAHVSGKADAVVRRRAWLRPVVLTALGHARIAELGLLDAGACSCATDSAAARGTCGGSGAPTAPLCIDVPAQQTTSAAAAGARGGPTLPLLTRLSAAALKLQGGGFGGQGGVVLEPPCTCGGTRLARWADIAGDGLLYLQLHAAGQVVFTVHGSGAHSKQGMRRKAASVASAWAAAKTEAGMGHCMGAAAPPLPPAGAALVASLAAAGLAAGGDCSGRGGWTAEGGVPASAVPASIPLPGSDGKTPVDGSVVDGSSVGDTPPAPPSRSSSVSAATPPATSSASQLTTRARSAGVDVIPIAWYEGRKARQGGSNWRSAAEQGAERNVPDDGLESDVTQLIAAAEAQLGACLPGNLKALRHLLYVQGFTATVYTTQHIGAAMRRHSLTHLLQMWVLHLVCHPALVPAALEHAGGGTTAPAPSAAAAHSDSEFQSPDPTGYVSGDSCASSTAPAASTKGPAPPVEYLAAASGACATPSALHVGRRAPVSIIAHSLGGMLTTDLLCGDSVQGGHDVRVSPRRGLVHSAAQAANTQRLLPGGGGAGDGMGGGAALQALLCSAEGLPLLQQLLPVSALVLAGSPVPLYLSARCLRPDHILAALQATFSIGDEPPATPAHDVDLHREYAASDSSKRIVLANVFHAADPVSQRMEPLLDMGRRLRRALGDELQPPTTDAAAGRASRSTGHHRTASEVGMQAALQVAGSMVAGSDPLSPDVGSSASESSAASQSDRDSDGVTSGGAFAPAGDLGAADHDHRVGGHGSRSHGGARHAFRLLAGPQVPPCNAADYIGLVPEHLQSRSRKPHALHSRTDFQVSSSGFLDRVSEYIAASTAHGSYWTSSAVAAAAVVLASAHEEL